MSIHGRAETSWPISSIGNSGARSSGPIGSRVPGCSGGSRRRRQVRDHVEPGAGDPVRGQRPACHGRRLVRPGVLGDLLRGCSRGWSTVPEALPAQARPARCGGEQLFPPAGAVGDGRRRRASGVGRRAPGAGRRAPSAERRAPMGSSPHTSCGARTPRGKCVRWPGHGCQRPASARTYVPPRSCCVEHTFRCSKLARARCRCALEQRFQPVQGAAVGLERKFQPLRGAQPASKVFPTNSESRSRLEREFSQLRGAAVGSNVSPSNSGVPQSGQT